MLICQLEGGPKDGLRYEYWVPITTLTFLHENVKHTYEITSRKSVSGDIVFRYLGAKLYESR